MKGLNQLGFWDKFFIAIFAGFVARGAWAQCCSCDSGDGCPIGQRNVGQNPHTWHIYCEDCVSVSGTSVDCSHCNCYGYDDNVCPFGGDPDGKKCKKVDDKCPNPCEYYNVCDIATGNITATQIVGECHMEGEICYSNRRACSKFATQSNVVICPKANQDGDAVWDTNHWVVNNCTCGIENAQFDTFEFLGAVFPIWCDDFYATYSVSTNSPVNTVQDKITYTATSAYCKKCHPGYLPNIMAADNNGVATRPLGTSGNWGVVACPERVTAPDYAPGCTIDFNETDTGVVAASCQKPCPTGFGTDTNGATQIEQCKSDGGTTYEDGTGYFIIPELASCG